MMHQRQNGASERSEEASESCSTLTFDLAPRARPDADFPEGVTFFGSDFRAWCIQIGRMDRCVEAMKSDRDKIRHVM